MRNGFQYYYFKTLDYYGIMVNSAANVDMLQAPQTLMTDTKRRTYNEFMKPQ